MKFYILNSYGAIHMKKKLLRIMKLTIVFMIAAIIHVSAAGFAQNKITLSVKDAPLEKVFKAIRKQSGFDFFFIHKEIRDAKTVSLSVKEASLEEALNLLFKNQALSYTIDSKMIIVQKKDVIPLKASVFINISGKVVDENGEIIPGATVKIKGTQLQVITDEQGRFAFRDVDENSILIVSYVGYKIQEVKAAPSLTIKLVQESSQLDDVVIVGYGTQSKKDVVASITQIKGEEIRTTPAANLQNMLQGKVLGLASQQRSGQPGADGANFYLRGVATENSTQTPLILIDDVEADYGQFSRIDPSEVENVSFLKDAASTAIYGIKGANGVVLVTTRRGKPGIPKFNFTTQSAFQNQIKPNDLLDSYESAKLWNEAINNEMKIGNLTAPPTGAYVFTDDDLQKFKDGSDPYKHPSIDWYDALFKKFSLMTTNNMDVSGGNDWIKYFVSVGYLWQNGILKDYDATDYYGGPDPVNNNYYYKRYNFRSNLDINATKNLSFKIDLSGNTDERNAPGVANAFNQVMSFKLLPPWSYAITNPDGSYGFTDGSNGRVRDLSFGNPNNIVGQIALGGYTRNYSTQLNTNITAIHKLDMITPGLQIKALLGYTNLERASRSLTRGDFPSYQYDQTSQNYVPRDPNLYRIAPLSAGVADQVNGSPLNRLNVQGSLLYDRSFGNHNVSALALFSSSSQTTPSGDINSNMIPDKLLGYTYRLSYNYKHKYILESSGAYNGSPRFSKHYGFFPSVAIGYNISEEPFFKKVLPVFSNLKIRGSYGIVGSDDIGGFAYLYKSIYNTGAGYNFGEESTASGGILEGSLGKDDVTWQKESKKDASLEFGLFKNKLNGSAGIFDNLRYDILYGRQTIPIFFGIGSPPPQNLGRIQNRGIEIQMSYKDKIGNVGYTVGAMYSLIKNKILEIDEPPAQYPWLQRTGNPIGVAKFLTADGFYSLADEALIKTETNAINSAIANGTPVPLRTLAIPSGQLPIAGMIKFRDLNNDGTINDLDAAYTGKPNLPQSNFSFNLGLSYKNFSAGVIFQGAFDYNLVLHRNTADPFYANLTKNNLDYWTEEKGDAATMPIMLLDYGRSYQSAGVNNGTSSTFWNIDAYYIRLRSANLTYNFNPSFCKKIGISNMRAFINGSNLFTISNVYKRYNVDPESNAGAFEGTYPTQKIYNLGLNVSF